ncbi:MAG: ATP-binding cassette domain-containing protein [Deltaproteobacteria bacterium]|nr:ATP-binding cassette domain-containing protein [Deltaproteobacteria bacterium]
MKTPLIQLNDIHKSFGSNRVLDGITLSIYQGEITTIIGKSGGGKSVLLKHIIGLLEPDAGQILFNGQPLSGMKRPERKALKRKFSYMFQGNALFDSLTVYENVALPLKETASLPEKEIRRRAAEKMTHLDILGNEDKYPSQLSGGMRKRVALARALMTDPEIILFDEPTTGLDPIRKNAVLSMISDYQKKFGFTGVVVSHEIPDIFYISQRIAMLNNGRILFEGSPDEIQRTDVPEIRNFIYGYEDGQDAHTKKDRQPYVERRFLQEMVRLQNHHITFSLVLFTFDNIDKIYEHAEHIAGQTVMENLALEIRQKIAIIDSCSRFGLNKIVLLLSNADRIQAHAFCESLASDIQGKDLIEIKPNPEFCFSISVGFAQATQNSSLESLLETAEFSSNLFYKFKVC